MSTPTPTQPTHVPPSEMARRIERRTGMTVRPGDISHLFYCRAIPDEAAPIMGGVRQIPVALEWLIEAKLRASGKMTNSYREKVLSVF
jgi:hypothetical protein